MKYPYEIKATKEALFETMLQMNKEIERLKEMEDKYILEKSKNDKAIEYIEQQYNYEETAKEDYDILLGILKGVDKE